MPKLSAGLLVYRRTGGGIEVLLVHPGGPFWAKKDDGAWSVPKGEYEPGEDPLEVALREFEEELGRRPPDHYRRRVAGRAAATERQGRDARGRWRATSM